MTSDESTWLWWRIMWATEDAVFKRTSGASSGHLTDEPEKYVPKTNKKGQPIGGIIHQNTCGHGFTWREKYHMAESNAPPNRGASADGPYASRSRRSGNTLLGASPSEIAFRGKRRRWSSE